jgi:regulator of protease activity HflC (stomatin/prohibitin superfamily)
MRILREYERGVVFTLGRYTGTTGPGLFLLVPFVQQMVRVDLRVVVDDVPPQDVISRDNVSVKVSAVIYFRVVDAERAIIQVSNYLAATSQLAQTTLRWVLGKHDSTRCWPLSSVACRRRAPALGLLVEHVLDVGIELVACFHRHSSKCMYAQCARSAT